MSVNPNFPESEAQWRSEIERRLTSLERADSPATISSLFNAQNSVLALTTSFAAVASITIDVPEHWNGEWLSYDAKMWFSCTYRPESSTATGIGEFKGVYPGGESDLIVIDADTSVRVFSLAFNDLIPDLTQVGSRTFAVHGRNTNGNAVWELNDRRLMLELTAHIV